jgi:hypothetical protein
VARSSASLPGLALTSATTVSSSTMIEVDDRTHLAT